MRAEFIDPGALRTELVLEEQVLTSDGMGGHAASWVEVAVLFARLEPVSAQSGFGADQTIETMTHRVTLRFRDDVRSGMRFRKQARLFEILTVHDSDETRRYLVCRTRETGL